MAIMPAAPFGISMGIRNGLTRRGPSVVTASCSDFRPDGGGDQHADPARIGFGDFQAGFKRISGPPSQAARNGLGSALH
jgi:hypothetical protein